MLRSLAIRDFTIIDQLELDFSAGFSAITGETGAGKSIVIDALGLLLGDRADGTLVAQDRKRADLSARFTLTPGHPALHWLVDQSMDDEGLLLLRRAILAEGGSKAWINGQPATVGQLREIGSMVVEIHGQHEHQQLADSRFQRQWLDRHVDQKLLAAVAASAAQYHDHSTALDRLLARAGSADDRELLKFQLAELDTLDLAEGEIARLETRQRRLASVEELRAAYARALDVLDSDLHDGAVTQVHAARRALETLADREPALADVIEMIATAAVNLDEAGAELNRLNESLETDPQKLEQVDRRLTRAIELARKHRIEPEQLTEFRTEMADRLARIENFDSDRLAAEQRLDQAHQAWRKQSEKLHNAREKAAATLSDNVGRALAALGMTDAKLVFAIEFNADRVVSAGGADHVEIEFSANPGQSPKPLRRVASGGELSRLSLAMIIASSEPIAGLVRVFDEIDAGVGGETAHQVGAFLSQASRHGQAFCVTHLAQVAACADQQFRVVKQPGQASTHVSVETLSQEQRVTELARMLGSARSETSVRHARSMLEASHETKSPGNMSAP
ncbi:MAG: DNA repair protein RecN [Wenzhouxiangellaceae bacterium]|nr:DNA repair protein RecN [Wenzhouxiangellaceae bacterium]